MKSQSGVHRLVFLSRLFFSIALEWVHSPGGLGPHGFLYVCYTSLFHYLVHLSSRELRFLPLKIFKIKFSYQIYFIKVASWNNVQQKNSGGGERSHLSFDHARINIIKESPHEGICKMLKANGFNTVPCLQVNKGHVVIQYLKWPKEASFCCWV